MQTSRSTPSNLLVEQKKFQEITTLLEDPGTRLVTLMGSGGLGKTRLVVEIISQQLSEFSDRMTYVSLDGIEDPNSVCKTIGESLNLREQGELSWESMVFEISGRKRNADCDR